MNDQGRREMIWQILYAHGYESMQEALDDAASITLPERDVKPIKPRGFGAIASGKTVKKRGDRND